jgi:glycosyltransferase involved in cell wall biosynthesis
MHAAGGRSGRRYCTILARNYLASARTLVASIARHDPGAAVDVVVVDVLVGDQSWVTDEEVAVRVLGLDELGLDRGAWRWMRAFYDVYELATAVKPAVLRRAREDAPDGVAVHLDPDTVLLAPLEGLEAFVTAGGGIALTPHVRSPIPLDGKLIDERTLLLSGAFNLGFLAVGPGSEQFLGWWDERLRTDAVVDRAAGLFTDQKWLDLAPALFHPAIIGDAGWNVAFWNLHERPLARAGDGTFLAGGEPVRLFHASGYDPAAPHLATGHQGPRPRVLLSEQPALGELLEWYAAELRGAGWPETAAVPYGWADVLGRPATTWLRRAIRAAVLDPGLDPSPPDPYDEPDAFREWLSAPVAASRRSRLPRIADLHWQQRTDLRTVFPDVHGADLDRYVYFLDHGADDAFAAEAGHLFEPASTRWPPAEERPLVAGTTVAGYLGAALGVGALGRLAADAAAAAGLPLVLVHDDRTEHHDVERAAARAPATRDAPATSLTVAVVNADALGGFLARHGASLPASGHRVGLWSWEVGTFPIPQHGAFALVDEVWTTSSFSAAALARDAGDVPVRVFPAPIVAAPPTALRREDLGLPPDRYLFGFSFDARSVVARKNPAGVVRAYLSAFDPDDGAALVVKVLHGAADVRALEELRWLARGRPDVVLVDAVWSPERAQAFAQLIDCYVSLHRAEGYGFGMAEAMAHGLPVVATGWSGNLEFMDAATAALVPFDLVAVGPDREPYPPSAVWAEPDLTAAAAAMRRFADDPASGRALGATARAAVTMRFPLQRAATFVRDAAVAAYEAAAVAAVAR